MTRGSALSKQAFAILKVGDLQRAIPPNLWHVELDQIKYQRCPSRVPQTCRHSL